MYSPRVSNLFPEACLLAQRSLNRGPSSPVSGPGVWFAVVPTRQDAQQSVAVYAKRQM